MKHVMIMIKIIIVIFDMSHMTKVVFFTIRMTNHLTSIYFCPKLIFLIFSIILMNNIFVVDR
jgi:hypothetical protein